MEFETPEAAAMAVESLNGSELGGRSVKIGRPNNFPLELPQGLPPAHDTRLYISNVHKQVTEEDISAVLATFGTLRQVSLVPDVGVGTHKGYGFVEFSNRGDAATALAALKAGFSLGGLKIRVGRTIIGGDMPPGMAILRKVPQQRDDKVVQVRKKLEEELTRN